MIGLGESVNMLYGPVAYKFLNGGRCGYEFTASYANNK